MTKAAQSHLSPPEILKNIGAFASFSDRQLQAAAKLCELTSFRAGIEICKAGEPCTEMYIVLSGQVRLLDADGRTALAVLSQGAHFGERSLFSDDQASDHSVWSLSEVTLLRLSRQGMDALLQMHPQLTRKVSDYVSQFALRSQELVERQRELAVTVESLVRQRSASTASVAGMAQRDDAGSSTETSGASVNSEQQTIRWQQPALRSRPHGWRRLLRRFPVVRQQSSMDCGAACLSTLCQYYGKRVSLNRIRELSRVGRAGASMQNLLRAAESIGFEGVPMLSTYDHLAQNYLPAIVNWNGYHWVVVYEVTSERVTIADPGQGLIKLSKDEFLAGWTRYTLFLRPVERFAQLEESPPTLRQFKPYIQPHRRALFEIALASLTIQAFGILPPMFTKFIIDDVIIRNEQRWLFAALAAISSVVVLNLVISYCRQQILLFVTLKVNLRLLEDFHKHVLSLPLAFFERRKVGDIISRFEENAKITRFFTNTGVDLFIDSITATVYLGLMFYYNAGLTIVAVAFLILHIVNMYLLTPHLQQGFRDVFQKGAENQSHLIESLSGLGAIKSLAIEHHVRWIWENSFARFTNAYFKTLKLGIVSGLASQFVNHAASVAILFYGAWMVLNDQLTLGSLVAFTVLTQQLTGPATKLVSAWDTVQETLNSVERLNDVYESKSESASKPDGERMVLRSLNGHVRFENVTYRYDAEGRNVLQNINLEVTPGQRVALVGRSGSGKSTIAKLLLGFYPATSGRISVDGFEIGSLWLPSLRGLIGVVPQDAFLFRGTIRENIAHARPEASLSEVVEAATLAGAHEFISGKPQGYDTVLEEQTSNLSGGERQRLAIARALLQNPRMLILDEATSALDNESERFFLRNLDARFQDRTVFLIAHRLSTVRNADLIVVLDHGNIVEAGNHEQLVARRGLYYFLSTQQLDL